MEIYREDVARFRLLLGGDEPSSSIAALERGDVPTLDALRLHYGTVYRWNRPCYGISEGKPHLRIEHRVLPAGPTTLDEIANAAFFFGLMIAFGEELADVRKEMEFDDAKGNFMAAARYGSSSAPAASAPLGPLGAVRAPCGRSTPSHAWARSARPTSATARWRRRPTRARRQACPATSGRSPSRARTWTGGTASAPCPRS